jgi:hypothetical protein
LENFVLKGKLDTIEDHHNKHTFENQCCPWAARWKNCLGAVLFFYWVLIRHPIFWKLDILRTLKNGSKNVKRELLINKGKEKERRRILENFYFKENFTH